MSEHHLVYKNRSDLQYQRLLMWILILRITGGTLFTNETNQRGSVGWTVWTLQLPDFICPSGQVKRAESDGWKGM